MTSSTSSFATRFPIRVIAVEFSLDALAESSWVKARVELDGDTMADPSLYFLRGGAYPCRMKATALNSRRAATAVGIMALFLTGWVVRGLPGSSGVGFFAWFAVVSVAIVGALTIWLNPRSRRSG